MAKLPASKALEAYKVKQINNLSSTIKERTAALRKRRGSISFKEEDEASHEIEGYKTHTINHNQYFNDDLGIDQDDYEVEQERYVVESDEAQPIAVDRYFERFGKSRRTPR